MWLTVDLAQLVQIALGATVGAVLTAYVLRAPRTRFALLTLTGVVCASLGVVTMIGMRFPNFPVLAVIGALSAAAPITLALAPMPVIKTVADAIEILRRAAASMTLHIIYGIAFAALGFACALGAERALGIS